MIPFGAAVLVLVVALAAVRPPADAQTPALVFSETRELAPGVTYRELDDPAYFGEGGPISARLLEVRPDAARLDVALGKDGTQGRATVVHMAARRKAIAAINAGFFQTSGDPAGIYKIDGLLVSETERPRAAVGFARPEGPPLLFDRVTAVPRVRIGDDDVRVTGIDTAHGDRSVVLYTPRFGGADRGDGPLSEWAVAGMPLRVTGIASRPAGSDAPLLPVPDGGFVISAAGAPPAALARLSEGDEISVTFEYAAAIDADGEAWARADDIIGGAGLLMRGGAAITDWTPERLSAPGFVDARHPRTVIGRDRDGDTWLITVDGRQPDRSVGMTLPELVALGERLGLTDALNLDGGGSTTMVVGGEIVNRPSDALGVRPVSDAIVVLAR